MVNLCFDDVESSPTLGYPNLARSGLSPDKFDITWPRATPLRLQVYFDRFNLPFSVHDVNQAPVGSWYPVSWGWHDFNCDYFGLMSLQTRTRLKQHEIRVLFYYHEGDNPHRIQDRLDALCRNHGLPLSCYLFISANSRAAHLERSYYFPDHEYFFQYVNRRQPAPKISKNLRSRQFTALNRTHKWWRAACMTDMIDRGLLKNSFWSYNTECQVDDREEDNPIEIDIDPTWRQRTRNFVKSGPYWCDSDDQDSHNDHRVANIDLWTDSYCNIVIETLFDADQSQGSFITEKTYKCLKYGQPFVIVGTAGSLKELRQRGYRVFDHAIDNRYDTIENNTERWLACRHAIKNIQNQNMHEWFLRCLPDVLHNQQHFMQQQGGAVEELWLKLTANSHTI